MNSLTLTLLLTKLSLQKVKMPLLCMSCVCAFMKANDIMEADIPTSKHLSWWGRLQHFLIKTNMLALASRLQKTSSRRLGQDQFIRLGHTSSRRLQDVLQKRYQDVFKTSSRRLQDISKTSSRHVQDVLQRYLQDVFKGYHQVKQFFLTVFEKYSTRFWDVLF